MENPCPYKHNFSKRGRFFLYKFSYSKLTILPTNICANEVLKLLDAMKNLFTFRRNKTDCSITSLVAPGLPIVPVKIYSQHLKFA